MNTRLQIGAAAAGLALALTVGAAGAHAEDQTATQPKAGSFAVRVGVADVLFNSSGKFTLAGSPVPGGSLKLTDDATLALEGAYYLTPEISLSLTVGIPPVTTAHGVGTLAPLGRLGAVKYGPAVGLVKYQLTGSGPFQPYIAGGATWMAVFKNKNGSIQNLEVDDHWGGAVQAGADYMITPKWGLYASASKLFLHTNGVGTFSGIPIGARIKMDPTILQGGVTVRF